VGGAEPAGGLVGRDTGCSTGASSGPWQRGHQAR
jgi:hypothetical protein